MQYPQKQPVIIGSGLSGMMISEKLSQAHIHHCMIGDPPNQLPRLGESLNLDGTLGLLEMFPEFARYYYPKKYSVGYLGDHAFLCEFAQGRILTSRLFFFLLGYKTPPWLIQFDRLGFDEALYQRVCASPYCRLIRERVQEVIYEDSSDTITTICFQNGSTLEPSYVFDATNHGRLLGQAAHIPCQMLSGEQRVVYTHYHADNDDATYCEEWEYSTNVIALSPEKDEAQAVAWCIPLGGYVSIGIQVKASDERSDEELLTIAQQAYARRGLHYCRRYPHPAEVMSVRHRFFLHERAYGGNWLLVGTAYCQIWWMSGAGVGMALSAAQVAVRMLQHPRKVGQRYQEYLQGLLRLHGIFDWFVLSDPARVTVEDVARQADQLVTSNLRRISRSTRLRKSKGSMVFGWLFSRIVRVTGFCRAINTDLASQTETIFHSSRAFRL
jgi:flavin-dependent dehydrogenase